MVVYKEIYGTVLMRERMERSGGCGIKVFCQITISSSMNCSHWDGDPVRHLQSTHRERCLPEVFIEMTMDICQMHLAVYGSRQT